MFAACPAPMQPHAQAARFKTLARECGFDLVGIAEAAAPSALERHFPAWIAAGHAADMDYLVKRAHERADVRNAFPFARSVVCLGVQYDADAPYSTAAEARDGGWISRYAWGDDYHVVVKKRAEALRRSMHETAGDFESRVFVDTGPVTERAYAAAAGLGAWGKNTCLLHPEHGSWFFLAVVVTDLELPPDAPLADMCGSCTACLEACPTQAFVAPYVLDARRCISYLTIETRWTVAEALREGMGRHVFGCDVCQDVCPWNRRRRHCGGERFAPRPGLVAPDLAQLAAMDEDEFRRRFRQSPVRRAKRRGLLRNVAIAIGNAGDERHRAALLALCADDDPVVREHAEWARERFTARLGAEPGR